MGSVPTALFSCLLLFTCTASTCPSVCVLSATHSPMLPSKGVTRARVHLLLCSLPHCWSFCFPLHPPKNRELRDGITAPLCAGTVTLANRRAAHTEQESLIKAGNVQRNQRRHRTPSGSARCYEDKSSRGGKSVPGSLSEWVLSHPERGQGRLDEKTAG